ncbi:MAG: enoyl-CoA hydratase/isomerase family protein [Steroidobacteraceae bacterium]
MSDLLDRRIEDGVLWLTLNRPERRNAVAPEMREEMLASLADAKADQAVRCIVITGAGDAFCSGVDLGKSGATKDAAAEQQPARDPQAVKAAMKAGMQRVIRAIWELEKPVVAAVNGVAAGGGAQLALVCDLVIASESARFIEIFVQRGLAVDSGGGWLLPRLIGLHRAKELVFFGDALGAADAASMGLINRVVADTDLTRTVTEIATRLATGATVAIGLSKRLLNRALETDLETALDEEASAQADNSMTGDFREGVRAFIEKRPPQFQGR